MAVLRRHGIGYHLCTGPDGQEWHALRKSKPAGGALEWGCPCSAEARAAGITGPAPLSLFIATETNASIARPMLAKIIGSGADKYSVSMVAPLHPNNV